MLRFFLVTFVLLVSIIVYGYNSPIVLAKVADLSGNNQSSVYVSCLDRIYSIIDCGGDGFAGHLPDPNENNYLFTWLRILSVSGNSHAANIVQNELENVVEKGKKTPFTIFYIKAAGSLGLESSKELLIEIAKRKLDFTEAERAMALSALYLIDGNNYGEKYGRKYIVDNDMENARKAILSARNNCRGEAEMLLIDELYRSPKNRKKQANQ